ncbi:MAG: DUF4142 domain-containing protein [Polaromonas sp.]|nr:DUF4142 domain-containing protein [Polaromonas sp.]
MTHRTTHHQPASRLRLGGIALAIAGASAFAMVAAPAIAQTATSVVSTDGKLVRADAKMLGDLAQGNRAEVAAGKLALEKSQDANVKKFAQQMIDDHGKALTEVESLASAKGVSLPDGVGAKHKAKETTLKPLSGKLFDRQYAKHAGVGDHEATVRLLKTMQTDGKDADVKALATKLLPTVEHHLMMAKELAAAKTS